MRGKHLKTNEESMKKTFSFGQCAAVVLICTGLVSTGVVWYVNQLTHKLETETLQILKEFADQDAQHVRAQVTADLGMLSAVATAMSILPDPTLENMTELLETERKQNLFKNMEIGNTNGITYLDNGTMINLAGMPHFEQAVKGHAQISERVTDVIDGSNILVESVPIKNKDEVIGVLMGTRSTAEFGKMLDMQSFGGEGYSLIVDSNGDKVVESFHKNAISGLYNIFDMPDDPDHELRHKVLSDFTARKSGIVKYKSAKRGTLYINYQPLFINSWYLISVVPEEHIAKVTNNFVTLLPMLCLMIALAALMLGAYLCYTWPNLHKHFLSPDEQ